MTIQELNEHLDYFTTNSNIIGLTLYVIYNDENNGEQIRIADIDSASAIELRDQYLAYITKNIIQNSDLALLDISVGDNRKNAIYNYDLSEKPEGLSALNIIKNTENHPQFSFSKDDFNNITAFVIALGTEENKILLYKKHHHLSVLHGASAFGIRVSDHRFVRVREDIIKLSPSIDFLQINDELIIINLKTLEGAFGFENIIRNKATQNIALIEEKSLIEDIAILKEMALDLKIAKRFMSINATSPVIQIPSKNVIIFVRSHPPIMKKFKLSEDGTKLKLDTKVSQKLFLALMNDDLLTSELTKLYYAGIAKDPMKIEVEETN